METINNTVEEPPTVSLEEALLACMPAVATTRTVEEANSSHDDANDSSNHHHQTNTGDRLLLEQVVPQPALDKAVLACMPGAYEVPTATGYADDPLQEVHVVGEEEDESVGAGTTVDLQGQGQQTLAQTNIVSAYRVAEEEPAIIATPLKYVHCRFLIYGLLATAVVALIVGLSVGLTTKGTEEKAGNSSGRLVSSFLFSADEEGSFLEASRYVTTSDNGTKIVTTTGRGVLNRCEVIPCLQGGCSISFEKSYEPGCCLGDDCSPIDKCGYLCPEWACQPSYDGCRDASCFECERGPNGEELYRDRDASYDVNCLRTGVATGFNDREDSIERIYKWAILCGFNVHGGNEWENSGPGDYVCIAARSGLGITKTISLPVPCQLIQLGECGCAPDDVNTLGLFPAPEKPCETKQDCSYLCGDAGEDEAKKLCEVFPGIEWWEGQNAMYQSFLTEPEDRFFGNVTIQIGIYEE